VLGAVAFLVARREGNRALMLALGATALFGAATLGVRQLDANRASAELAQQMPQPADFVDRLTGGQPAGIVMGPESDAQRLYHLQFWNASADRAYRIGIPEPRGFGQLCPIDVDPGGQLRLARSCAGRDELPRWLAFVDQEPEMGFANGVVRHEGGGVRLVEFPVGDAPRLQLPPGRAAAFSLPPDTTQAPAAGSTSCARA
jgi:hypothetical protein